MRKRDIIIIKCIVALLIPFFAIGGIVLTIGSIIKALGCLFFMDKDGAINELEDVTRAFKEVTKAFKGRVS